MKLARFLIAIFVLSSIAYSQNVDTQVILHQNYSNPFNPTTIINYALPESGHISIKVYNVIGRKVVTLVDEWKTAGSYTVKFSADNISSGLYFLNLRFGRFNETKKILYLK